MLFRSVELLHVIFSIAHYVSAELDDVTPLVAAASVCRAWRKPAQAILFSHPALEVPTGSSAALKIGGWIRSEAVSLPIRYRASLAPIISGRIRNPTRSTRVPFLYARRHSQRLQPTRSCAHVPGVFKSSKSWQMSLVHMSVFFRFCRLCIDLGPISLVTCPWTPSRLQSNTFSQRSPASAS